MHQENWGLRKLEYPIAKKTSGFYHLFEFVAEGSVVKELELQYRRDEKVMRYLTVSMDKHAIAYAEKRRNLRKERAAVAETEAAPVAEQPAENTNNE